jgi:mitochondrial fission protein ELM1
VNTAPTAWLLTDGAAGNRKQAEALATALGLPAQHEVVATRVPWRWFAPRWVPGSLAAIGLATPSPWPALAIGCGRQGALALRVVRAASGGATRTVQILDPRIDPAAFDAVVVPAHDPLRGPNVIVARGALHAVDEAWLAQARQDFATIGQLPRPRTVLLLGGDHRAHRLDEGYWRGLATKLGTWLQRDGGSLLVSTSRRSPDWLRRSARAEFSAVSGLQWHGPEDGPNPYPGLLAWADRIVVTPDSVNLLSEACATEVPVLCHLARPVEAKLGRFLQGLVEAGRVRPMESDYTPWAVAPLRDTAEVAARVRVLLAAAEEHLAAAKTSDTDATDGHG